MSEKYAITTDKPIDGGVVYGNLIRVTEDYETEVAATGAKVKIPEGTRGVITAASPMKRPDVGHPIVLLENGYYLPMTNQNGTVPFKHDSDFDLEGFAVWILNALIKDLKISEEEMEAVQAAVHIDDCLEDVMVESIAKSLADLGLAANKA